MTDKSCDVLNAERSRTHGCNTYFGQTLDFNRTEFTCSKISTAPVSRTQAAGSPQSIDGYLVRSSQRHSLGDAPPRDGLRFWNELLAVSVRLATRGHLAKNPRNPPEPFAGSGQNRLVPGDSGQFLSSRSFWGAQTGPNPTDRRKKGSKHHLVTDAQGVPLAAILTPANAHDVTQLIPLLEAIPPIRGKQGRPRQKPDAVQGDRAYNSEPYRQKFRAARIRPLLAKRNTGHGSGLGRHRWVVERSLSWLHQFRRLRIRYERRADIHEAFLKIGCIMICFGYAQRSFC